MKRDINLGIPQELREADELLEKYGAWAQDRYKKQHCASIEHKYRPPDFEPKPEPFIADFKAMDIQHALQVVPMQYRRVLHAMYIPQRLPAHAIRRQLKLRADTWQQSHIQGLRNFWSVYRLRYLTKGV